MTNRPHFEYIFSNMLTKLKKFLRYIYEGW